MNKAEMILENLAFRSQRPLIESVEDGVNRLSGRQNDLEAIYFLGKQKPIRHHLIVYDRFNRFKFFKSYTRPLVAIWLGMNYPLDKHLVEEIRKAGVDFSKLRERFPEIR